MTFEVLGTKDPDTPLEVGFDFEEELVQPALRQMWVAQDAVLRYPHLGTGFYYVVTIAGRLKQHIPTALPRADGQTFTDGSATLVCRHPSNVTVPLIQSATWALPSGLTLSSQSQLITGARAVVAGGVADEDYEVNCRVTPTVGNPIERTGIVQVRSQ